VSYALIDNVALLNNLLRYLYVIPYIELCLHKRTKYAEFDTIITIIISIIIIIIVNSQHKKLFIRWCNVSRKMAIIDLNACTNRSQAVCKQIDVKNSNDLAVE